MAETCHRRLDFKYRPAQRTRVHVRMRNFRAAVVSIIRSMTLGVLFLCGVCVATTADQAQNPDFLVAADSVWRYKAGNPGLFSRWRQLGYDDSQWHAGKAGFGYGDDDDRTVLPSMRGKYAELRIRHRFEVSHGKDTKRLYLYMRFDDAFIAYLNGKEVARSHVVDTWNGRRIEAHESRKFERFAIHDATDVLRDGQNILAVVGFNRSLDSTDFSLHAVLTTRKTRNPGLTLSLGVDEMLADVDYLRQRLEDQSSYLHLRDEFNYEDALAKLRQGIDAQTSPLRFARELASVISQIGDAHAEVKVWLDEPTDRCLPFRLADTASGIVAIDADGEELLSADYPLIRSIDGIPIEQWLRAAGRFIPRASPQLIRRESLRELRSIDRIREQMALPRSPYVTVSLRSPDGDSSIDRRLETLKRRLPSSKVKFEDSRLLESNIGYLRIPAMSADGTEAVLESMSDFRDTEGLIIDVRGNRGGFYPILQALYGYFVSDKDPPYVANIAAYRLSSRFGRDHLADRPTFRASHDGWTAAEKAAITAASERFQPEWPLPPGQFSDWHYMLLGRSGDKRQYHYTKPVAVLSDAASYSATDGFLSAFADLPGVVIVGGPSAGASGASESFILPNSGIQIVLSSMASFRPNGSLYDGNGIEVDIPVSPTADDFLGRTDTILQRAIEWIRSEIQKNGTKK